MGRRGQGSDRLVVVQLMSRAAQERIGSRVLRGRVLRSCSCRRRLAGRSRHQHLLNIGRGGRGNDWSGCSGRWGRGWASEPNAPMIHGTWRLGSDSVLQAGVDRCQLGSTIRWRLAPYSSWLYGLERRRACELIPAQLAPLDKGE